MNAIKIPITIRATMARIQRKLKKDGERLKSCSSKTRAHNELGNFYIVSDAGCIIATHIDLEKLAKEMFILKPYEEIEWS